MQNQENENQMGHSRVLKFRAWDNENKEWINTGNFFVMGNGELGSYGSFDDTGGFMVQPIINQFTGILDCTGREIFEGDIVQRTTVSTGHKKVEIVKWVKRGGYEPMQSMSPKNISKQEDGTYKSRSLQVVGNIYENPELIK